MRIACYHRVSTLDQRPELARDELTAWTGRQGGAIALLVEESGSGARNDRPGLQRVLAAARAGELDCVAVWKLDRFGRSTLDVLANIERLTADGVRFAAISQGLDVKPHGDAMSRLILTVLAGVAEFERELIRERTHLGLERARRAGKLLGRRVDRDAPSARTVGELRAVGASWSEVAERLGCTPSAARRALARGLAENGAANGGRK